MAVQTTYTENQRPGVPGQIVDMTKSSLISRTVSAAGGLPFGVPVARGTGDNDCRPFTTGDTLAKYLGISVRDRSVSVGANQFSQYEDARIMRTLGCVWVTASVQVAAGDPVYIVVATGVLTNVATSNVQIPGAVFDTSTTGANQLAQVRLG